MRTLLFVLLLLVVGVVVFGFYRGWFSAERTNDPETGRQGVKLEIDQNKIRPDLQKAKQAIGVGGQTSEQPQGKQP